MSELLERLVESGDLVEIAARLGTTPAKLRRMLEAAAEAQATIEKVKRMAAPLEALRRAEGTLPSTVRRLLEADDKIEKEFDGVRADAQRYCEGERAGYRQALLELAYGLGLVPSQEVKHPVVRDALRSLANAEHLPSAPALKARSTAPRNDRHIPEILSATDWKITLKGLSLLRLLEDGRKTSEALAQLRGVKRINGVTVPLGTYRRAGLVDWCDDGTWGLTADGRAVVEAAGNGKVADGDG